MKRILLIFILTVCVCGCIFDKSNNEYENFEHYDLNDRDTKTMSYQIVNDKTKQEETYVVTDITPEGSEVAINGLFYKVSDNDYIKLDEFDSSGPDDYKFEDQNYFSVDKLYITRLFGSVVYEYTLDGGNTKKKDLSEKVVMYGTKIKDVKNGYVYFEGQTAFRGNQLYMRCSLKTSECEECSVNE